MLSHFLFYFSPVPPTSFSSFEILIPCYLLYGYNNLQYTKLYNKHVSEGFRVQKKKRRWGTLRLFTSSGYFFWVHFSFSFFQLQYFSSVCYFLCIFFLLSFFCIFAAAQKMFLIWNPIKIQVGWWWEFGKGDVYFTIGMMLKVMETHVAKDSLHFFYNHP